MVRSHRWSFSVQCPACESTGVIGVSEDAGAPFTDQPRRSLTAPEGFRITDDGLIECGTCGARVPQPH